VGRPVPQTAAVKMSLRPYEDGAASRPAYAMRARRTQNPLSS
jgi:hypothetical protein